ncbi:MAG: FAD-dependent oxidoreductase [Gammaproteobacteria bacterium]|nr:FAD-dependent oxidoreductase [Gammaproteobacteria bacterium]
MPSARVIVIGGGVVGCSVLYHLARLGWGDVLLLERDELTAGSTWHAAGNCPNFATSWSLLRLQSYSTALYRELARETGYDINYHLTGSLRLAHTRDRVDEFRHVIAQARAQGLEFALLSPAEMCAHHPYLEAEGIRAALWDPLDGDIDPAQLTQALVRGARARGARVQRHTRVTALQWLADRWRLDTDAGPFEAEYVVNAGGYRGAEIAALIGEFLPIVTLSHQYLVTEDIPALTARGMQRLPLLRDPDVSYYLRQERHGLLLGPYESAPRAHWLEGVPEHFAHQLFADDLARLESHIAAACARVPLLGSVGIRRVINGPIPYAPDGNPLLGPAANVRNFFHCCAFTFGIVQAGGAGRLLAEWLVNGEPGWDIWPLDTRRFCDFADRPFALAKALETYRLEYAVAYPQEERPAGRPGKTSPLYERLRERGAVHGARGGWERALYFTQADDRTEPVASFRRDVSWRDAVERECLTVAHDVALCDLPGFGRFEICGSGAGAWLDRLSSGRVPAPGRVALNYLCSPRGGIVAELTIAQIAPGQFWLIGAAAGQRHDEEWLRAHLPPAGEVSLRNCSAAFGALLLTGPRSRALLAEVVGCDLSNRAFPWFTTRALQIAGRPVVALRVSYAGELGWELHVAREDVTAVYEALQRAADGRLRHFGLYALESLRLEKCYRSWKVDLTQDYTPIAASLERLLCLDKPTAFIGKAALQREVAAGARERFVPMIVAAGDADAAAVSIIYRGAEVVGLATSGGYGHRLGCSIALGYVRRELSVPGTRLEIEILGERRPAVVATEPLYDPDNLRLRG